MRIRLPWRKQENLPTLVHITHIKAGSTWVDGLLRELFGARVKPRFGSELFAASAVPAEDSSKHPPYLEMFQAIPFESGAVYPAMFITRDEFETRREFADARRFVVIRDLRDTLTSHYFSLKGTHAPDKRGRVRAAREFLQSAAKDEGFRYLFDRDLARLMQIQRSWLGAGEIVVRYEDLVRDPQGAFVDLFINKLQLPVREQEVAQAVEKTRFETVFQRKLGELNEQSHGRQGLPGDWANHFSPALRQEFQERVGDLLVLAGYEPNESWVDRT